MFLSLNLLVSSQNNSEAFCGNETSSESLTFYNSIKPQLKAFETEFFSKRLMGKGNSVSNAINSIPVKAHVFRNSDGSGGISISEIYDAMANLNSIYADAYLEFFLCDGIDFIDDDNLCMFKKGDEKDLTETHYVPDVLNIYFAHNIVNDANESICGYSDNAGRTDVVVIKNSCAVNGSSLEHELGHYFSLLHTHGVDNISLTTELVDGSNCDTDGDGICDTPADPKLTTSNVDEFCNYTGTEVDANGQAFSPDTGNMMSYASKDCRTHFSPQQLARMYAFYMSTKNYLSCPSFNADIAVTESETCEESLTVNFESLGLNISNWQWDVDGDGIIDYTSQNPTHTYEKGIYTVTLTVSNKERSITKTFKNFIKVGTDATSLEEDFEDFDLIDSHGWTSYDVTGHGYHWYSQVGETLSTGTGPLMKSSENEKNTFMYAEASGAQTGDEAVLISPCVYIPYQNSELEFSYHMFGKDVGELHIDLKTDSGYIIDIIPPLVGSQQNNQNEAFKTKIVDLAPFVNQTIKVRFRAVRGNSWSGDIAIDDVHLQTIDTAITSDIYKVYPNPIKGDILNVKNYNPKNGSSYRISNLMGQTFLMGSVNNQPIDLSSLSSGTYILTLTNGKSKVVKRFIK